MYIFLGKLVKCRKSNFIVLATFLLDTYFLRTLNAYTYSIFVQNIDFCRKQKYNEQMRKANIDDGHCFSNHSTYIHLYA